MVVVVWTSCVVVVIRCGLPRLSSVLGCSDCGVLSPVSVATGGHS